MTPFLLATIVSLNAVQLGDSVAGRTVRLIEASTGAPNLEPAWSDRAAFELGELEAARPSLVSPIAVLGVGIGFLIAGLATAGPTLFAGRSNDLITVVAGLGCLVTAAVHAVVGAVLLGVTIYQRSKSSGRIEELKTLSEQHERREAAVSLMVIRSRQEHATTLQSFHCAASELKLARTGPAQWTLAACGRTLECRASGATDYQCEEVQPAPAP